VFLLNAKNDRAPRAKIWLKIVWSLSLASLMAACGSPAAFQVADKNESFGQVVKYNTKVDVLWIDDNSSSMAKHQDNVAAQASVFVDWLTNNKFDFHLAVTTTDFSGSGAKGSFVGQKGNPLVISRDTPNAHDRFSENVRVGENGSDLEQGLSAMKEALSPNKLNGVNSGFFRADAMLAVVALSDEDDQSVGTSGSYAQFLDQVKPPFPEGGKGWLFNSIVVPQLDGPCRTLGQYVSPGYRYMDLSKLSDGAIESICSSNFASILTNIRARIVERLTEYRLASKPVVSSIQVHINGVGIPQDPSNGWTYDPNGYRIKFHGSAVPAADAVVQVNYTPDLT